MCETPTDTWNPDEVLVSPPHPPALASPVDAQEDLLRSASAPGMRGPAMTRAGAP